MTEWNSDSPLAPGQHPSPAAAVPRMPLGNPVDQENFLDLLGHELRNPLAPIQYAVHLIRNSSANPSLVESACAIVERQVSRLARLVDGMVDLSRLARGKLQLNHEPIELVELVRGVVLDVQAFLLEKGVLLVESLPSAPVWLEADPVRLEQALANLLQTAIGNVDSGGEIGLVVQVNPGGWAEVAVQDTRAGLRRQWLTSVPEPEAGERSPSSMGLGVALIQGLVALHGGTFQGYADQDAGSGMSIRLPVAPAQTRPPAPVPAASAAPSQGGRRILIVEDLFDAAITMELLLEMLGHTVEIAADGVTGLEKATSFVPDVVLCDIGLPGQMDGYDLARAIRATPGLGQVYLIALTGFGTEEDKDRARQAGFDLHLTKPVDPAALEPLIARIP